jgi:Lrp/AsnC family transcriptional regulator, leucine-responsive regulatory protein
MKDIRKAIVSSLKSGNCTPQISVLAKKLKEPSTTLHYNIKKLEQEGAIKAYKAVFDYKRIEEGFCAFVLLTLSPGEYGDPERIGRELSKHPEIESVDVITGDWEMIIKVRTRDQDAYYELVKKVISRKGVEKIKTLTTLKQVKTEFVNL